MDRLSPSNAQKGKDSRSASAHTIQGFFPPSSSVTLFRLLREAASLTNFPTFGIKNRPKETSDAARPGLKVLDKPRAPLPLCPVALGL